MNIRYFIFNRIKMDYVRTNSLSYFKLIKVSTDGFETLSKAMEYIEMYLPSRMWNLLELHCVHVDPSEASCMKSLKIKDFDGVPIVTYYPCENENLMDSNEYDEEAMAEHILSGGE